MKKIFALILAVTMCLSLCFVLGSCQLFDATEPDNDKSGEEKKETVYTITKDEWDANLNEKNFTAKLTSNIEATMGEMKVVISATSTVHQGDTKAYTETYMRYEYPNQEPSEDEEIGYYEQKGDVIYEIKKDESGAWVAQDCTEYYDFDPIDEIINSFDEEITFEKLTYDEENKVYTIDVDGSIYGSDTTVLHISFKFENAKIVKIDIKAESQASGNGETAHYKLDYAIDFSNLGTTTVEVPAYTVK